MRLAMVKASKFEGAVFITYALLTGAMTLLLIIASRATLGHLVGEGMVHTSLWTALCAGAGSLLSGFLVRLRLIAR